jgi:hypothetical protein
MKSRAKYIEKISQQMCSTRRSIQRSYDGQSADVTKNSATTHDLRNLNFSIEQVRSSKPKKFVSKKSSMYSATEGPT